MIGPINLLSDRLLRYILIFEYQILVLDIEIWRKFEKIFEKNLKKNFFLKNVKIRKNKLSFGCFWLFFGFLADF